MHVEIKQIWRGTINGVFIVTDKDGETQEINALSKTRLRALRKGFNLENEKFDCPNCGEI